MKPLFVRVTEHGGKVQWVNLHYVRQLVEPKPGDRLKLTTVCIGNSLLERQLLVQETAEEILAQAASAG